MIFSKFFNLGSFNSSSSKVFNFFAKSLNLFLNLFPNCSINLKYKSFFNSFKFCLLKLLIISIIFSIFKFINLFSFKYFSNSKKGIVLLLLNCIKDKNFKNSKIVSSSSFIFSLV